MLSASVQENGASISVALVDHGTPAPEVNRLRNAVAADLGILLRDRSISVTAASMERREGVEYAFNEPLLENLNSRMAGMTQILVVAMFFLLPGRHAGDGGDVAEICEELVSRRVFSNVRTTSLIANILSCWRSCQIDSRQQIGVEENFRLIKLKRQV